MDLSNALEMQLTSTRVSRPSDLQAQEVSTVTSGQSQSLPHVTNVHLEVAPSFSLALDRTANDLNSETTDRLVTGSMSLGSAVCKVRTVDTSHWQALN